MSIGKDIIIVVGSLSLFLATAIALYLKYFISYRRIHTKYKDIIDIDKEVAETRIKFDKMKSEYQIKRNIYEELLKEISILEEDLEFTSMGIYKPHYNFDTSEKYKIKLEEIRKSQKQMIKDKKATVCDTKWEVSGSKREGTKMTNRYLKLMLKAFNGESDAAVLKVRWNNVIKMEKRLEKTFESINSLGSVVSMRITNTYLSSKLEELILAYEYQEKKHEEKEEQRRIRGEMREEEKLREEIEKAQEEAEADEERYEKALSKAREEVSQKQGKELEKLNKQLAELEERLKEAQERKERAISRAQMTKSGYIYVISNMGSFGENMYKIGLTRRLEPMDRVRELGDASVPFTFDVHAMIYSENAPNLEYDIQKSLEARRVNMVNRRKEFFNITLDEIEKVVKEKKGNIEFTKLAEAKEYRQTLAIAEEKKNKKTVEKLAERFPASL